MLDKYYYNNISFCGGNVNLCVSYENFRNVKDGLNLSVYDKGGLIVNIVIPSDDIIELLGNIIIDKYKDEGSCQHEI